MKVSYRDTRGEEMRASQWRQIDNADATTRPGYPDTTDSHTTTVRDCREISIRRENDDDLPATGESFGHGRDVTFAVRDIVIRWERSWSRETPRVTRTGWRLACCTVSGPQIKTNKKLSNRIYNNTYPTYIDTGQYPNHTRIYTPVPEWVSRLIAAYSPVTGTPYLYGDSHTYGGFSPGYEKSEALKACLFPGV